MKKLFLLGFAVILSSSLVGQAEQHQSSEDDQQLSNLLRRSSPAFDEDLDLGVVTKKRPGSQLPLEFAPTARALALWYTKNSENLSPNRFYDPQVSNDDVLAIKKDLHRRLKISIADFAPQDTRIQVKPDGRVILNFLPGGPVYSYQPPVDLIQ
jgi:hypothetical protein